MESGLPYSHLLILFSRLPNGGRNLFRYACGIGKMNWYDKLGIIHNNKNKKKTVGDRSGIGATAALAIQWIQWIRFCTKFIAVKIFYSSTLLSHMQWFCGYLFCYLVPWASIKWNSDSLFESYISGPTLLKINSKWQQQKCALKYILYYNNYNTIK